LPDNSTLTITQGSSAFWGGYLAWNTTKNGALTGGDWAIFGYQTDPASLPVSGLVSWSGFLKGEVFSPAAQGSTAPLSHGAIAGQVYLNADFGTGAVKGYAVQNQVTDAASGQSSGWNNLIFSGAVTSNRIAGTVAANTNGVSSASATFTMGGSAAGTFNGGFYGPTPIGAPNGYQPQVEAVWTLADGASTAEGVFSAVQYPPTFALPGGPAFIGAKAPSAGAYIQPIFQSISLSSTGVGWASSPYEDYVQLLDGQAGQIKLSLDAGISPTPNFYETVSMRGQTVLSDSPSGVYADMTPGGAQGPFSYLALGQWVKNQQNAAPIPAEDLLDGAVGWVLFGMEPASFGLPTSGATTYALKGGVLGTDYVYQSLGGQSLWVPHALTGDGSVTVDFASNTLKGAFTNMTAAPSNGVSATGAGAAFSSFALSGTLNGASSPHFSGVVQVSDTPASQSVPLNASASGSFSGSLYGPNAEELGLIWSISDSSNYIIGAFAGLKSQPLATISSFAAASVGLTAPTTAAAGYQTTTSPSISTPVGAVFALTQSAYSTTTLDGQTPSVTADQSTIDGGATLTATATGVEIKIPNLGVDATLTSSSPTLSNGVLVSWTPGAAKPSGTTYAELGQWAVSEATGARASHAGWAIFGYQTPVSNMPLSGSASYAAAGGVQGEVFVPGAQAPYTQARLQGDVSLTANFSGGAVSGALSNMTATDTTTGASAPWNGVAFSGTLSGNTFTGAATVSATPTGSSSAPYVLGATASGQVRGGFYGPSAAQAAALFTLSDGRGSAVGGFTASKTAPSDRRLKTHIRPLGRTLAGAPLYQYRYFGDRREFIGVMAQDLLRSERLRSAVVIEQDGYYAVDYGRLAGFGFDLAGMRDAGAKAKRWLAHAGRRP